HVAAATATSIIYESPNRLVGTLEDLLEACGQERRASVSREISKLHHETVRGSLAELVARFGAGQVRGEIVIVVAPADEPEEDEGRPAEVASLLAGAGVRGRLLREALSALGVPRNEAYKLALEHPEP